MTSEHPAPGPRAPRATAGGYAAGRATREALIVAAQRLFAERGFDGVSLREVNAAAGTRNTGAAQYYFGDRETLILAIFQRRLPQIMSRRLELLARAGESADPARTTLEAIIVPLADQIGDDGYLSYLARFQAERTRRGVPLDPEIAATWRRARDQLRQHLPPVSDAVFHRRFALMANMVINALADAEWQQRTGRLRLDPDEIVAELIDVSAALMAAPSTR